MSTTTLVSPERRFDATLFTVDRQIGSVFKIIIALSPRTDTAFTLRRSWKPGTQFTGGALLALIQLCWYETLSPHPKGSHGQLDGLKTLLRFLKHQGNFT